MRTSPPTNNPTSKAGKNASDEKVDMRSRTPAGSSLEPIHPSITQQPTNNSTPSGISSLGVEEHGSAPSSPVAISMARRTGLNGLAGGSPLGTTDNHGFQYRNEA